MTDIKEISVFKLSFPKPKQPGRADKFLVMTKKP